jgi:hypothetical protein
MFWKIAKTALKLSFKTLKVVAILLIGFIEALDQTQPAVEDYLDGLRTRYYNDPEDAILNGDSGWW